MIFRSSGAFLSYVVRICSEQVGDCRIWVGVFSEWSGCMSRSVQYEFFTLFCGDVRGNESENDKFRVGKSYGDSVIDVEASR